MNDNIETREQLATHEGKTVTIRGTLVASDTEKRLPARIELKDGSFVYLGTFAPNSDIEWSKLQPLYGRAVVAQATLYSSSIPEKHNITGRLNGPYLVDITAVNQGGDQR